MSNFIESFCKVKDCYVDLYVVVHPFGDVVGCQALMEPPEYGLMHSSVKGSKE
jgi:hypothetical protein